MAAGASQIYMMPVKPDGTQPDERAIEAFAPLRLGYRQERIHQ